MRAVRKHVRGLLTVAAAVGLMLLLPSAALAQGNPNKTCATNLIAKFEAQGPNLVFEKGTEGVITIVNVETDDDGEPISFEWTSSTEIGSVIVKGGQETMTFSGDTTTIDFDSPPAISNVQFCGPDEDTGKDDTESEGPDDETTDDSTEAPGDNESEVASDSDAEDQPPSDVGNIPIPNRIDTGAGGGSRPSFGGIIAVLSLVFVTAAGVTAGVIRRRG
jgi:hypothetical protein